MRRVGLIEAIDDPALLNFPAWPRQRELLRAVETGPRIHVWALGRRSGKSSMAALVGLWDCCLREELRARLRPGERRHVVAVATSARQARLVVQAARAIVGASPLLANLLESETEDDLHFSTGATFSAFPCTSRSGRGWPISTLILDEAAHHFDVDGSAVAADAVWRALSPSTIQFGPDARLIVSSTPFGSTGWFAEMFMRAANGEIEDACAATAPTADVNPTISEEWLAAEEAIDPEAFKSEFLAQFVGSGGAFFIPENITAATTLAEELHPKDLVEPVVGLDPAFAQDTFAAVAVGRSRDDPRRLLVGAVRGWTPLGRPSTLEENREVEDTLLAEVATFVRAWGGRAVTDQYRAAAVKERLERYGLYVRDEPMTAATKDAMFGFVRGRLNEGSILLPEHPELTRELRAIRTRYRAGRSAVVLPRIGGSHCDRATALALAVYDFDRHSLDPRGAGIYPPSWNGREYEGARDPYAGVSERVLDALRSRLGDTKYRPTIRGATRRRTP